jgi:two-component system nitrate/nitrite response regulator NarL
MEANGLLREGLSLILNAAQFNIVVSAPALNEALLGELRCADPKLLIIGGHGDAQETARQIQIFKTWSPEGLVIALVGDEDLLTSNVAALFAAGANACLSKITTSEALIKSLELIALGETIISQQALRTLLQGDRPLAGALPQESAQVLRMEPAAEGERGPTPSLSLQERRILRCVVEGASNKAIARKFDIAEATVKVHLKAILRKIRLNNRTQAAVWALNNRFDFDDAVPPQKPALPGLANAEKDSVAGTDASRLPELSSGSPETGGAGPGWTPPPRHNLPGLRRVK